MLNTWRMAVFMAWLLPLAATTTPVHAQEPFFKEKSIRIIVGFSAGGGYDVYARAIARHTGKHLPGNPNIVVENMAGAASLISANHVYKVARADGLTIGYLSAGFFFSRFWAVRASSSTRANLSISAFR